MADVCDIVRLEALHTVNPASGSSLAYVDEVRQSYPMRLGRAQGNLIGLRPLEIEMRGSQVIPIPACKVGGNPVAAALSGIRVERGLRSSAS